MRVTDEEFLTEGAEAEIYTCRFLGIPAVLKKRTRKEYRNEQLDRRLRVARTRTEAICLSRAKEGGVLAPAVLFLSLEEASLVMQYVEGPLLRRVLTEEPGRARHFGGVVGRDVARLHGVDLMHGDLTTANMILRDESLVYVDFGLSRVSQEVEEKATDIELLTRVVQSTHPEVADEFMEAFRTSYLEYGEEPEEALERMERVKVRGRYVSKDVRKSL